MAINNPRLAADRPDGAHGKIDHTPADHVARRQELEQAWIKLLALAGALDDLPNATIRVRVVEMPADRMKLLRVWDTSRAQGRSETIACLKLAEGWRFVSHPSGPTIADADGTDEPAQAHAAACVIAARVVAIP